MKFTNLREFREVWDEEKALLNIFEYLKVHLTATLKNLSAGLRKLNFEDNFEGWTETNLSIPAGTEVPIRNQISPEIPTKRIIVRGGSGAQSVTDGVTDWNSNFVYLTNQGGSPVTISVVFLK